MLSPWLPSGCRVGVLVRHEVALTLLGKDAVGQADGAVGRLLGRGEHNLGTVGLQDTAPLKAHAGGHDELHPVPPGRAEHGERYPRVAGRRLQDRLVPGELTAFLAARQHIEGRPVLNRPPGVVSFQLGEDPHPRVGVDGAQFYKRGIANPRGEGIVGCLHRSSISSGRI